MSFWNLNDNSSAANTTGEFDAGGGNMEPIPSGTQVLAAAEEASWDDYEGDEFISIRWTILAPAEFKNRKVFQKLYVLGDARAKDSAKKADKAKRMLAAIDMNAGGKLLASGEKPTDESLTRCLVNKPMMLRLEVWEMELDGAVKSGNWVSAVAPRNKQAQPQQPQQAQQPQAAEPVAQAASTGFDDDIPF